LCLLESKRRDEIPLTQNTYRRFSESERHISNKAFRNHLLNDEESLVDDDGNFSELGMVMGKLAKMFEENDGPARVQKIIEKVKRDMKGQN